MLSFTVVTMAEDGSSEALGGAAAAAATAVVNDAVSPLLFKVTSRIATTGVDVLLRRRTLVVEAAYGLGTTRDMSVRLSRVAGRVP